MSRLGSERATAPASSLRVRVVEDEPFAEQARVVLEDGPVQVQEALLVDEDLRAVRPLEHLVARPRLLFPREGVTQARAAAAFDPDAESALGDALLRHQRADFPPRVFTNLNHAVVCASFTTVADFCC